MLSVFKTLLQRLKRTYSCITEIYVTSDNTSCYQNGSLLFRIHLVVSKIRIHVILFLHIETQDGKALIDTHFVTLIRLVWMCVNSGNDYSTEQQLAVALRSSSSLTNTAFELIFDNYSKLEEFFKQNKVVIEECNSAGRYNEVMFYDDYIEVYSYSVVAANLSVYVPCVILHQTQVLSQILRLLMMIQCVIILIAVLKLLLLQKLCRLLWIMIMKVLMVTLQTSLILNS